MTEYVDFVIQLNEGGGGEYRNIFECTNLRSERHEFISKDTRKSLMFTCFWNVLHLQISRSVLG